MTEQGFSADAGSVEYREPSRHAALFEKTRDLILLLAAHILHCFPLYNPNRVFMGRDLFLNYYPIHWVFAERIRNGEIPLWNPYLNLGIAFWADPVNAVLYPPHWLLALTGNVYFGVSLLTALHFLMAELLFYGFLKSLNASGLAAALGAIIYSTSGFLTMEGTAHQFLYAHALAPGLAWAVSGYLNGNPKGLFMASVVSSLILLAGEPQTFVIAAPIGILAVGLGKKRWSEFAKASVAIGIVPFLLWAPVLLPMLSFASETTRTQIHVLRDAEQWSIGPLRLFDLFAPFLFGECVSSFTCWTRENGGYSDSFYMGAAAIPIALGGLVFSRRRKEVALFLSLAVAGLLLAAGEHLPFYRLLYSYLPGWNLFRYPERMLWLTTFGIGAAVGLSIDNAGQIPQRYRTLLFLGAVTVIVDIAAGNSHDLLLKQANPTIGYLGPAVISRSCLWALSALAVSWGLVGFATRLPKNRFLTLMVIVMLIDVAGITGQTFRTVPLETIQPLPPAVAANNAAPPVDEVPPLHYADPRNLTLNIPLNAERLFGRELSVTSFYRSIYMIQSLEGGMAASYRIGTVWGPSDISFSYNLYRYIHTFPLSKAADFFGIKYMTSYQSFALKDGWEPIASQTENPYGFKAFAYKGNTDSVLCPASAVSSGNFAEMYRAVAAKPSIIRDQLMFEGPVDFPASAVAPAPAEKCGAEHWSPESVTIRVKSDIPRWMVYRRSYSKGWTAKVNGKAAKLYAAYGVFPALPLDAGDNRIELSYEPPYWKTGMLIAVAVLAGMAGWFWQTGRREKLKAAQPPGGSFS